jgi:CRISPR-associated protein (TIGR03984 family)
MTRTIQKGKWASVELVKPEEITLPVDQWLFQQGEGCLLIHADDGIIWGRIEGGVPTLKSATSLLIPDFWQQARLFDKQREVYLWKAGTGQWSGRIVTDEVDNENAPGCIDEQYLLWGNRIGKSEEGFTPLYDASQGLEHIIPKTISDTDLPMALLIRHYIEEAQNGFNRIAFSRLVDVLKWSANHA